MTQGRPTTTIATTNRHARVTAGAALRATRKHAQPRRRGAAGASGAARIRTSNVTGDDVADIECAQVHATDNDSGSVRSRRLVSRPHNLRRGSSAQTETLQEATARRGGRINPRRRSKEVLEGRALEGKTDKDCTSNDGKADTGWTTARDSFNRRSLRLRPWFLGSDNGRQGPRRCVAGALRRRGPRPRPRFPMPAGGCTRVYSAGVGRGRARGVLYCVFFRIIMRIFCT